jgi:hypothetical protein
MAVEHLHEAGIDALREARVVFDLRAGFRHRRRVDVVDHLHRVRIAHRDHRHQHGLPGRRARSVSGHSVSRPCGNPAVQALAVERHRCRLQHGRAHVDRDAAVVFQARRDDAGHGLHADAALAVKPLSLTKRTKAREPLPHCSTSPPSLLKMR